jgi:hypothetical protein
MVTKIETTFYLRELLKSTSVSLITTLKADDLSLENGYTPSH